MFFNGVVVVFGGTDDVVFPLPVLVLSITGDDLPGSAGESFFTAIKKRCSSRE